MSQAHVTHVTDEQFFLDLNDDLGGVDALREGADEFHQAVKRLWPERDTLVQRYPGKWVAMGKDGVVHVGDSMEEVLSAADIRPDDISETVIEYLDPNPATLIL